MRANRRLLLIALEPLIWLGLVGLLLFVVAHGLRQTILDDVT